MKTAKSFLIIIVVLLICGILLVNKTPTDFTPQNIKYVEIAGQKIEVEIVSTEETRSKGLGGRSELAKDEGMLFVFDESDKHYFWMKDMNFAIDIIWFNEDLSVIHIEKDVKLGLDNILETFGPDENSRYVLEVNAGFSDKNNLKVGDKVEVAF